MQLQKHSCGNPCNDPFEIDQVAEITLSNQIFMILK